MSKCKKCNDKKSVEVNKMEDKTIIIKGCSCEATLEIFYKEENEGICNSSKP